MVKLGQRAVRIAAIVSLVAMLVAPVVASRHQHGHDSARPCAACVAAHHSPAVAPVAPVASAALVASLGPTSEPLLVLARLERSPHVGRAPPHPSTIA